MYFRVRKDRIGENITSEEQLALLKQTGMELEDFMQMENGFVEENLNELRAEEVTDVDWLNRVLTLVYSFPSIASEYSFMAQEIKDVIEDKEDYAEFVRLWLTGEQYWQIAENMDLDVDDVMVLLGHLQYHFHIRLQGLIRYVGAKYEFSDDCLTLLPECIKYGICNETQAVLIKSGLRDRIALHKVAQYVKEQEIGFVTAGGLRRKIRRQKEHIDAYMGQTDVPLLTREKIENWIG